MMSRSERLMLMQLYRSTCRFMHNLSSQKGCRGVWYHISNSRSSSITQVKLTTLLPFPILSLLCVSRIGQLARHVPWVRGIHLIRRLVQWCLVHSFLIRRARHRCTRVRRVRVWIPCSRHCCGRRAVARQLLHALQRLRSVPSSPQEHKYLKYL